MDSSSLETRQENDETIMKTIQQPCAGLLQIFQLITVILLSLLLPLAFLLLARLTAAHYLVAVASYPTATKPALSLIVTFFLSSNATLLHYVLAGIVTCAALIHSLSGRLETKISESKLSVVSRRSLYAAWIFLCCFQVSVCLGIEGSIAAGVDASGFGQERGVVSRFILFLGLHETMRCWSKTVVRPVVDDTLFGYPREERRIEKVAMALSFGMLWWWKLRDEIEAIVVVVEEKKAGPAMGLGVADFAGLWLYFLTLTIGVVRVVKSLLWLGLVLFCRRRHSVEGINGDIIYNDDKV